MHSSASSRPSTGLSTHAPFFFLFLSSWKRCAKATTSGCIHKASEWLHWVEWVSTHLTLFLKRLTHWDDWKKKKTDRQSSIHVSRYHRYCVSYTDINRHSAAKKKYPLYLMSITTQFFLKKEAHTNALMWHDVVTFRINNDHGLNCLATLLLWHTHCLFGEGR